LVATLESKGLLLDESLAFVLGFFQGASTK